MPTYASSLAPEALSWLLLPGKGEGRGGGGRRRGFQMRREPRNGGPQWRCQLPSSPRFLTDTPLMFEARTVIKDVCTLEGCHVKMTMGSSG